MSLLLSSCGPKNDEIKARFEKYPTDNSIVVILEDRQFYFTDREMSIDDLAEKVSEENISAHTLFDGKIYFAVSTKTESKTFSLKIYSCDLYGNDKQLVFEKHGYRTSPWGVGDQGVIYIYHYTNGRFDPSSKTIDSYNILTGEYKTVAIGNDVDVYDYRLNTFSDYERKCEENVLTYVDPTNNKTYTVDLESSQADQFNEALIGLEYGFSGMYTTEDGRILLLYRILHERFPYPHFVCEYLPETNKVEFRSLIFAYEYLNFNIVCMD